MLFRSALIEHDLTYESLRAMRGQVIADFVGDNRNKDGENIIIFLFPMDALF